MRSKNQHVLGIRTSSESVSCKICGVSPQGLLLEGPSGKKLLSKTSQSEDWSLASCSLTAATASSKGATAPWGSGWPKKEKPSQLTKFLCFWNALFPLWNNWIPFWNQMQHLWRICDECSMAAGLQSWHPSEGVYQPPDFIHSTASIVSRLSYHDIWCKVVKQKKTIESAANQTASYQKHSAFSKSCHNFLFLHGLSRFEGSVRLRTLIFSTPIPQSTNLKGKKHKVIGKRSKI